MVVIRRTESPQGKALREATKSLNGVEGRVGWFPSAKYETGVPVATVAVVQEYGSGAKRIPPRPFMRTTQAEKKSEWKETAARLSTLVFQGRMAPGSVMSGLTQAAEGAIRRTISKITSPPLSPRTIQARRSRNAKGQAGSKPLVDTGQMLGSLTSQVTKK